MGELNEVEKSVLRNLIADRWSKFVVECEHHEGVDPDELYAKLGGERGFFARFCKSPTTP